MMEYKRLQHFEGLVERRKKYLDGLESLKDDWIYGNSCRPTNDVIAYGKTVLSDIVDFVSFNPESIPKLIIGPKPKGGLILELIFENGNSVNINLDNNTNPTLELEIKGNYSELSNVKLDGRYLINNELERLI